MISPIGWFYKQILVVNNFGGMGIPHFQTTLNPSFTDQTTIFDAFPLQWLCTSCVFWS